ncbi:MAG: RsmG family class I SAM-dependent methyltransferase [Balneolaceae bacterium]
MSNRGNLTVYDVSRETLLLARDRYNEDRDRNEYYLDSLLWWNERVNLVSRNVSRETLREHIIHSLLPDALSLFDEEARWVDAGTGGGLPGIPLALANPQKEWVLNDVVQKKIVAVRQIAHLSGLENVVLANSSVEVLRFDGTVGVVSKHAFSVMKLLDLISGLKWSRIVMYKGVEESVEECKEISPSLSLQLFRFQFGQEESFYQEKGLLVVDRTDN